jgi:hypothetical protein
MGVAAVKMNFTNLSNDTFTITQAGEADAETIAALAIALTGEICERSGAEPFLIDLPGTTALCRRLVEKGHYTVLLGKIGAEPVAVATVAESYALYAAGKVGIVQEWTERGWACIELCTPPLPAFDRALQFYERQGFKAVGGRKMRRRA